MQQYSALLSVIFMMIFVLVFDRIHQQRSDSRFCAANLLAAQDMDRILRILAASRDC
jgi:hypothetical protein